MLPKELLEGLFDEKKLRLLSLFINEPDEEFYLREAGRKAGVPPATTYRIINQLVSMNLLAVNQVKRTKLYKLAINDKAKLLQDILEQKKGAVQEFVEKISSLEGVQKIILHGKQSKDKTNILVVGRDIESSSVKEIVGDIKSLHKISIIELTLDPDQFRQMSQMGLFPHSKKILWQKTY